MRKWLRSAGMRRRMQSVPAAPTKAELQEVADRIASRFNWSAPVSKEALVAAANEVTLELGLECEARFEDGKLVVAVLAEPTPEFVPITVTAKH